MSAAEVLAALPREPVDGYAIDLWEPSEHADGFVESARFEYHRGSRFEDVFPGERGAAIVDQWLVYRSGRCTGRRDKWASAKNLPRAENYFASEQGAKEEQRRRFASAASRLRDQVAELDRAIATLDGAACVKVGAADSVSAATAVAMEPMAEIGERLRTQNNRATSHPIFLVEQQERIYGLSSDYTERFTWLDESGVEADTETATAYEDSFKAGRSEIGMKDYARVGYADRWIFATACLTEQGAKAYIAANGHNLKSPRIYVASGYRNLEWQAARSFLLSLAGGEA